MSNPSESDLRRAVEQARNILTGPFDYDVGDSPGEAATEYEHRIGEAVRVLNDALGDRHE